MVCFKAETIPSGVTVPGTALTIPGIGAHDRPERVLTIVRNTHGDARTPVAGERLVARRHAESTQRRRVAPSPTPWNVLDLVNETPGFGRAR